jgi:ABC-type multidrug transport system fused ATPase/permease subunit
MTNSTLKHQKEQLAALRVLIQETASEESDLRERIDIHKTEAESKKATQLEQCSQLYDEKSNQAIHCRDAALAKTDHRRKVEPEVLKNKHDLRVSEIELEAEELHEHTQTKLNEAIWLAESVYEGAIYQPRKHEQKIIESFEKTNKKLLALCEEAPKILSKLRQSHTKQKTGAVPKVEKTMEEYTDAAALALRAIQSDPKAKWFVGLRPAFIVCIATAGAIAVSGAYTDWKISLPLFAIPIGAMVVSILALITTFASGKNSVRKKHNEFNQNISLAKEAFEISIETTEIKRKAKEKAITTNRDIEVKKAEDRYKPRLSEISRLSKKEIKKEKARFKAVAKTLASRVEQDEADALRTFETTMAELDLQKDTERSRIQKEFTQSMASIQHDHHDTMERLTNRWNKELQAFHDDFNSQIETKSIEHPPWDTDWASWNPNVETSTIIPVGNFAIDLVTVAGILPTSENLSLPIESSLSLPVGSTLPGNASILVSSSGKQRERSIAIVQNAIMRILTAIPPGKAKFTLIDPVSLGQSFAGVMHLADYEDSQLLDRAWTEPRHIEAQLARLTEHMETVIQKYLRNEFESIDAYNEQAGEIAEPYRFLVIADLPNNFSELAAKRLASIVTSGSRCGVYVIVHRDLSIPLPSGIDEDTLQRIPFRIVEEDNTFCIDEDELRELPLNLELPPDENTTTAIVKKVGETADSTHRVEVPFGVIAPSNETMWSRSTSENIAIPLGRSGATKLQNLTLGKGTAQHALIAGKTGSGKSTLLHVLITNLALWYSPDEVEFYLVDFKKGVEFKMYATHKLPHARVVAVESDREFGISVLQRVDAELKRRGELFRDVGVQDIAGFREKSSERMPRILLIIDEFQEFFIDDDRVAQEANLLLDRLVRQGRAFGIHAIMGSQTLDGAYTLSRSTMGQMAVRVALQCSEQDSYIILNEDNAAARLLSRPGEAIYNDAAGNIEGNSPFQVVWITDSEREVFLENLATRDNGTPREMVVYEGNQPVYLHENAKFNSLEKVSKPLSAKAWLGGAMAIKEDTSATFRMASASNLLIVGQQDETTTNMVASSLRSLDKQYAPEDVSFILLDGSPQDQSHASILPAAIDDMINKPKLVGVRDIQEAMASIDSELQKRIEVGATDAPVIYFIVNALHRFRDLRRDEDDYGFSMNDEEKAKTPSQIFTELLKEGPTLGMHVICSTDTLANLNRTFDRQALREFDMRVLLQMGANDSTNLIDMPDASRLGMHRALLYSEESGTIEPFRPYAPES